MTDPTTAQPDLRQLTIELAQVMRDANTPDVWDITRGLGPNFVPFDHFAEVAIAWMHAAVLPAHRAQVLDEAAEAVEDITGSLVCAWTKGEVLASLGDLAATGPTASPASTLPAQHAPAVPQETERQSYGCDDCDRVCTEKCACTGCTAPEPGETERG